MWPPSSAKIDSVTLTLATAPATLSAAHRREHCLVSQQVLDDLSRTVHPTLGNYGQIRVMPDAATGRGAVFTIAGINGESGHVVSVYPDTPGATNGGPSKLFPSPIPAALGTGRVAASPASTVTRVLAGGLPQTVTIWPSASGGNFAETVVLGDGELLVTAPHGGVLEAGTAEQVQYLVSKLAIACPQFGAPTVWYCQNQSGTATFNRWHITSTDINEHAFAGLDEIWKAAPHQGPIRYRYAVSLHGMGGNTLAIVIGGRANPAEKQLIGDAIASKFPAGSGLTITYEANGVGGTAANNFINRLSQNAPPSPSAPYRLGRGGIQIEQSAAVRAQPYRDLVIDGLSEALTELLGRNRVYVRDHLGDDGTLAATPSYMSPDVCIRKTALPAATLANKSATLENEELPTGTAATVYVRAYNASPVLPLSDIHAHVYDSVPSTLVQPHMWNPLGRVSLGAVDSATVPKAGSFTTPAITTAGHRCLVCILADEAYDLDVLRGHAQGWSISQFTDFIRRSRLAAWRNYEVITVTEETSLDVMIPGFEGEDLEFRVELVVELADPAVELALVVPAKMYEQLDMRRLKLSTQIVDKQMKVRLPRKPVLDLGRGVLPGDARHGCRIEARVPKGTSKLGTLYVRQIWAPRGRPEIEVGRVTWELRRPKTKPSGKPKGALESGKITAKPPARKKPAARPKPPAHTIKKKSRAK
jgi:phage replication-related protein YjqB (UPF0714/DUF867 family)